MRCANATIGSQGTLDGGDLSGWRRPHGRIPCPTIVAHRYAASTWERPELRTGRRRLGAGENAPREETARDCYRKDRILARQDLRSKIPHLRAFAISLARNPDRADDLVQQTLLRAYSNIQLFDPDSNMSAWLVTILRNEFYSEQRRRRREIPDSDGAYAGTLVIQAGQVTQAECQEFYEALGAVPEGHVQGAFPDRRLRLFLCGSGSRMRLRCGHDQEPCSPGSRAACGNAVAQGPWPFRRRRHFSVGCHPGRAWPITSGN